MLHNWQNVKSEASAPSAALIERFDHQLDHVKSHEYNETQLRIDIVNPMFRALGWTIDNAPEYAE